MGKKQTSIRSPRAKYVLGYSSVIHHTTACTTPEVDHFMEPPLPREISTTLTLITFCISSACNGAYEPNGDRDPLQYLPFETKHFGFKLCPTFGMSVYRGPTLANGCDSQNSLWSCGPTHMKTMYQHVQTTKQTLCPASLQRRKERTQSSDLIIRTGKSLTRSHFFFHV